MFFALLCLYAPLIIDGNKLLLIVSFPSYRCFLNAPF